MAKGEEIPKTNPTEIEALIARVRQSNIEQRDVELIERLLRTVLVLVNLLQRKNISIKKLRDLVFGRRTEKRKTPDAESEEKPEAGEGKPQEARPGDAARSNERSSSESQREAVKKGPGRRAAAA